MSFRIQSVPGEFYHVFNRGVEKRVVFTNDHDYQRFLILMFLVNDIVAVDVKNEFRYHTLPEMLHRERVPLVDIHAFSLLPNHYHLLLSPLIDGGIAKFIQKLATGYTMYFNTINERSGALFQGKYKIKYSEDEFYTKYLFEYIHLNSIRERFDESSGLMTAQLLEEAERYQWSSLGVYKDENLGPLSSSILNQKLFSELFSNYAEHKNLMMNWRGEKYDEGRTFVE